MRIGGLIFLGLMCGVAVVAVAQPVEEWRDVIRISREWKEPVSVGLPVNTPAWEDSPGISPDGTMLFFSRGRYDTRDVNVYYSVKAGDRWGKPVFCEFNSESSPTSAVKPQDDQTVYFASVRPGGYGNGDIYIATRQPDGTWSAGENIGPPVNTQYNESEPCVSSDGNTLYFTSNRPGGMGGMDTWMSAKVDGKWSEPVNLGSPANSAYDDLQPFVTNDGKSLYFVRMNFADSGQAIKGYHAAIYKSDRVASGWSEPVVVVSDYVGEPSLTADGRYLYFVRVIFAAGYPVDADIMVAEHE